MADRKILVISGIVAVIAIIIAYFLLTPKAFAALQHGTSLQGSGGGSGGGGSESALSSAQLADAQKQVDKQFEQIADLGEPNRAGIIITPKGTTVEGGLIQRIFNIGGKTTFVDPDTILAREVSAVDVLPGQPDAKTRSVLVTEKGGGLPAGIITAKSQLESFSRVSAFENAIRKLASNAGVTTITGITITKPSGAVIPTAEAGLSKQAVSTLAIATEQVKSPEARPSLGFNPLDIRTQLAAQVAQEKATGRSVGSNIEETLARIGG